MKKNNESILNLFTIKKAQQQANVLTQLFNVVQVLNNLLVPAQQQYGQTLSNIIGSVIKQLTIQMETLQQQQGMQQQTSSQQQAGTNITPSMPSTPGAGY